MKLAPVGSVPVESAGIVPSESLAVAVKVNAKPSVAICAPIESSTGAWLPDSVTVMTTCSLSIRAPSSA